MIVFVWTEIKICVYYRLRLQSSSCGRGLSERQVDYFILYFERCCFSSARCFKLSADPILRKDLVISASFTVPANIFEFKINLEEKNESGLQNAHP